MTAPHRAGMHQRRDSQSEDDKDQEEQRSLVEEDGAADGDETPQQPKNQKGTLRYTDAEYARTTEVLLARRIIFDSIRRALKYFTVLSSIAVIVSIVYSTESLYESEKINTMQKVQSVISLVAQ